jgi:hypothetical protein
VASVTYYCEVVWRCYCVIGVAVETNAYVAARACISGGRLEVYFEVVRVCVSTVAYVLSCIKASYPVDACVRLVVVALVVGGRLTEGLEIRALLVVRGVLRSSCQLTSCPS